MHLHLLFLTTIITVVYFCFISNLLYSYIARNDRWFAYLHIQNGGSKIIWILTYSW
jgi:hypothetical protein